MTRVISFVVFISIAFTTLFNSLPAVASAAKPSPAKPATPHLQMTYDCAAQSQIPEAECEALVVFYYSLGGDSWSDEMRASWLVTNTPCSWLGISCASGHVSKIRMGGLTGSIPPEMRNFTGLQEIFLPASTLSGGIPPELGSLPVLQLLDLHGSRLTGIIPPELGNLPSLQTLNLRENALSGSIPASLGDISTLETLDLRSNDLIGSIPPELGSLPALRYFDLSYNLLSGSIPSELGNLQTLQYLDFSMNKLTGSIPSELGSLPAVQNLNLCGNELTGSIPSELGSLPAVQLLCLGGNGLTGSIPSELGQLTVVRNLILGGSQLTGSIPSELGNLTSLEILSISYTQLTGSIPPELGQLPSLQILGLGSNRLTGSIPPELGQLTNLLTLNLENNMLTGSIPLELAQLPNLDTLNLSSNRLTGNIPPAFSKASSLTWLNLGANFLTGGIPSELGSMTNLQVLHLYANPLTGKIPQSFVNLAKMLYFSFDSTSICEPDDPALRAWKDSIGDGWVGTGLSCGAQKPWLLMYYLAGDNDLSYKLAQEMYVISLQKANPNVHLAVFFDNANAGSGTEYRYYHPDGDVVVKPGELNTGDPSTLENFIRWARGNYAADHTALIISDHGHGLTGVAIDETSNDDKLTAKELQQALTNTGKVDVLLMSNCLTGNLELAYELRGLVDYYVASESIVWLSRAHNLYIEPITTNTTPLDLSISMATTYHQSHQPFHPSTISVVDIRNVENVAQKTNSLARAVRASTTAEKVEVWKRTDANRLQHFDEGDGTIDNFDHMVDLYDFAELMSEIPSLTAPAQEVITALNGYIVYNVDDWSGSGKKSNGKTIYWDHSDAHGVSIALPKMYRLLFYNQDWLEFAGLTNWGSPGINATAQTFASESFEWGQMAADLIAASNPSAPAVVDPPTPVSPLSAPDCKVYLPVTIR